MQKITGILLGSLLLMGSYLPIQARANEVIPETKKSIEIIKSDPLAGTSGLVDEAVVEQMIQWNVLDAKLPLINMHTNALAAERLSPMFNKLTDELNFNAKFFHKDPSLWKDDAKNQQFIAKFLGWTDVYNWTLSHLDEVNAFASAVKQNFDYVIVMGMGGSSLSSEGFRLVFGKQAGWPELIILDTTNPDQIAAVTKHINLKKTLFIYASKSGSTVEPAAQYAYFSGLLKAQGVANPGQHFAAITDPNTGLEALAKKDEFRKIFLNPVDIGGRFSALSMFGIVPAAVMGVEVEKLLTIAQNNAQLLGPATPAQSNVALTLGAFMAANKDGKMILLLPDWLDVFGVWVEQLVAESLGKDGTGIVPVAGNKIHLNGQYSDDQFFVRINTHRKADVLIEQIENNLSGDGKEGHGIMTLDMPDPYQIGAMMLVWEIATAAAGAGLHVNPFDQPHVQAAKNMTTAALNQIKANETPADLYTPLLVSQASKASMKSTKFNGKEFYDQINPGDYIGILAYLNPTKETDAALTQLRETIKNRTHQAVTLGYGPRYLHSTGQLHKGGKNQGVFLIIAAKPQTDVEIPGQGYTFEQLTNAQSLGDFQALDQNGRRAVRIFLDGSTSVKNAIKGLIKQLK